MREHGGVWLPDGEQHLVEWMAQRNERDGRGRLTYQFHKLREVVRLVEWKGCAVDVGAHCGLWATHLADRFEVVHCFEPVREHVECLLRNCAGQNNVHVHEHALGEATGRTTMRTDPTSSGDTYPVPGATDGLADVRRLDDLDLGRPVDLIKLDCEGFELFALRGAEATIRRDRPVVIVEQKPGKAQKYGLGETAAVAFLEGLGMRLEREMAGDYLLKW